ncbi:hypothetical protein BDM02DRAFT_3192248 [Thelephora ganbajun]|uniref:Uncharacterized protein n=1 Tax=Thelephora ganbajun TaxID=370292 RepID=A0ACB6Z1E1_THEGA|nr:hypothetical protein BDM02DRAFT_3192248 [Thelephora ganbajun]
MTPEECMPERVTRERQRESKGELFNLEEEGELTHYGRSPSKLDDYGNIGRGLNDGDEDTGQIDSNTVQNIHFRGLESDEDDGEEGLLNLMDVSSLIADAVTRPPWYRS